jgi:hypothetical protein
MKRFDEVNMCSYFPAFGLIKNEVSAHMKVWVVVQRFYEHDT